MMLKRRIESTLEQWLDTKYALLVTGARQVGKTYAIEEFIRTHFEASISLNLRDNVPLIKAIIGAKDQRDFLLRLSAFSSSAVGKGGCIFIDDIQDFYAYLAKNPGIAEYFDLLTAMKDITENTGIRFVLAGLPLCPQWRKLVNLNPEGSLLQVDLSPMDFEEFLWARGVDQRLIGEAIRCIEAGEEVPDYLHDRLLSEFRIYLLVGGMPGAVDALISKNSFAFVDAAHEDIDRLIRRDIAKYAPGDKRIKIESIYELLPRELSSPTKRFMLSHMRTHGKNDREDENFDWLNQSGTCILARAVAEPTLPLRTSSPNKVKVFHEDVGLLTYLLMDAETKQRILLGESDANFGAIYENAVAELLRTHGFKDLYFYFQKARGEVDFLFERCGKVHLVEIKSGKDYSRLSALRNLLATPNYSFASATVYYNGNVKSKDGIRYLPIYAIEFLSR